ncbi:MAG: radical SAM protein [Vulcanimicrobiota bacterium]
MKKPRTLLVTPRFVEKKGDYYNFPLGLAYISSSLKQAGFEVECLNLNHYDNAEAVLRKVIRTREIDVVGTGAISPFYRQVRQIYDVARDTRPDIITLGGGGIISSDPTLMLELLEIDYGVFGEGEETTIELMTALEQGGDISKISGLAYRDRKTQQFVKNCARKPTRDLDSLPWPDYDSFDIEHYIEQALSTDFMHSYVHDKPREAPLIASRSCPFDCTFCYLPMGRIYRERTLDGFFSEIEFLLDKYKLNILTIYDDLFAVKKDRLIEFCSRIKKYNIPWISQLRVNVVDTDTLRLMKDAGCYYISYGLESGSPTILKSMKKKITVEDINRTVAATKAMKIGFQGNFLFGDTNETWDTVLESVEWYRQHPEYQILLIPVGAFPGAEIYEVAVKEGRIPDKKAFIRAGSPLTNISKLSDDEYQKMLYLLAETANTLRITPKVIKQRKQPDLSLGRTVWEITFCCPHCKEESTYKNVRLHDHAFTLTGCRRCHGRFWFEPIRHPLTRFLDLKYMKQRFARYGLRATLVKSLAFVVFQLLRLLGKKPERNRIEQLIDPLLPRFPARSVLGKPT